MQRDAVELRQLINSINPDFERGLSSDQAKERLRKYGRNVLVPKNSRKRWAYLSFLAEPMVWLLALASVVYWFLGDRVDSIITGVAVIPIGVIDVIIDVRTNNALEHLRDLREPRVTVIRNGSRARVPSEELVPGDHVIIEEGELVMADAAITESSDLKVDESPLTGESIPVEKRVTAVYSQEFFGNTGSIFAGTRVLMGRANCIVVNTGHATSFGKVGSVLSSTEAGKTKLQGDIRWVVTRLGAVAVALSVILVLLELFLGYALSQAVISGVSLAIAAIPEELPVVFTLFLTLGMLQLAHSKAVVRRLPAVEALGSVNVVCTDKTGTMTSGKMSLAEIVTDRRYSSAGFLSTASASRLMLYAMMACEKEPFDYMEQAIVRLASHTDAPAALTKWALEKEYPFDENLRMMSHVWRGPEQEHLLCAKGAVESILGICNFDENRKEELLAANRELGSRGIRVLALAYRTLSDWKNRAVDEAGLTFAGLLGFSDPIREGIRDAVIEAQSAGVRVVMLTGDHRSTADAIAHEAGLVHDIVVEGSELDGISEERFLDVISRKNIFCRILPQQKLRIVEGLQKLGSSVAVTGDGINDAPALKKADIGIAMGERGTEVAKDAASMILLDDNFGTIVNSIRNGRRIYDNLQSAFGYIVAFHVPIFLSALIIPLLRLPLLLLPIDIVLLELVLHPVVSIVFQAQPANENVMHRGPRPRTQPIMESKQLIRLTILGVLIFGFSLLSYLWAYGIGESEDITRGFALATMIIGQTVIVPVELGAFEHRHRRLAERNKYLVPSISLVLLSLLAILYVPVLAGAIKVGPPGVEEWLIITVFGLLTLAFAQLTRKRSSAQNGASL